MQVNNVNDHSELKYTMETPDAKEFSRAVSIFDRFRQITEGFYGSSDHIDIQKLEVIKQKITNFEYMSQEEKNKLLEEIEEFINNLEEEENKDIEFKDILG
jgi:hypothetical protein